MRPSRLTPVTALVIVFGVASHAHAASPSVDDVSIGTTPARSAAQPAPMPRATTIEGAPLAAYQRPDVYLATEPPTDWAVLHAGFRPHLGTFGGIATFALAHERTERFYGGFSLAVVRNDAGTHVGLAQVALGRNLADDFVGGVQTSLSENRARSLLGVGQLTLAYNRAGTIGGVAQVAAYNRARVFAGVAQVGGYNRADETFTGIAEIGGMNHAQDRFTGLVQLGLVNVTGSDLRFDDTTSSSRGRFAGLAQLGAVSAVDGDFAGITQVGLVGNVSRDFDGLAQIGAYARAGGFRGLAQVGVVAMTTRSYGMQIGAGSIALEEHTGLQLGGVFTHARTIRGAQIGLVNDGEHVHGLQIGVFNNASRLRGVQIGLVNHAEDGLLPWSAILNMGFGDGDGGGPSFNEYREARAE